MIHLVVYMLNEMLSLTMMLVMTTIQLRDQEQDFLPTPDNAGLPGHPVLVNEAFEQPVVPPQGEVAGQLHVQDPQEGTVERPQEGPGGGLGYDVEAMLVRYELNMN